MPYTYKGITLSASKVLGGTGTTNPNFIGSGAVTPIYSTASIKLGNPNKYVETIGINNFNIPGGSLYSNGVAEYVDSVNFYQYSVNNSTYTGTINTDICSNTLMVIGSGGGGGGGGGTYNGGNNNPGGGGGGCGGLPAAIVIENLKLKTYNVTLGTGGAGGGKGNNGGANQNNSGASGGTGNVTTVSYNTNDSVTTYNITINGGTGGAGGGRGNDGAVFALPGAAGTAGNVTYTPTPSGAYTTVFTASVNDIVAAWGGGAGNALNPANSNYVGRGGYVNSTNVMTNFKVFNNNSYINTDQFNNPLSLTNTLTSSGYGTLLGAQLNVVTSKYETGSMVDANIAANTFGNYIGGNSTLNTGNNNGGMPGTHGYFRIYNFYI